MIKKARKVRLAIGRQPALNCRNDFGLPRLTPRIGILRIVVDRETVLGAVQLKQAMLAGKLPVCLARRFH